MPDIKPYIVIPNLIEQPTWGGSYIAAIKSIKDKSIRDKKLGQSYELYEDTNLSSKQSTEKMPSLELGNPANPPKVKPILHSDKPISIKALIKKNPVAVLGKRAIKTHGKKIGVLNKLTQALGNSYQIHPKQPVTRSTWGESSSATPEENRSRKWLPKPESWYYLEPGLVTLGVKKSIDWQQYEAVCQKINHQAENVSLLVQNKEITLHQARRKLTEFIKKHHPEKFVNLVQVGRNQAIDLSAGGIHHSWEEDKQRYPQGNIVYEVQKNVYDPASTIRCFDKGKIKDDGSIRELQIGDYFRYIDRGRRANTPANHFRKPLLLKRTSKQTIKQIFETANYSLQQVHFANTLVNKFTQTENSFHHLFVREGNIKVLVGKDIWTVTQGYSIFIPEAVGRYKLEAYKSPRATLLKTYV